ncbi:MAG TPA: aromatic acid exporter family protein [Enteractinococcus sp.]
MQSDRQQHSDFSSVNASTADELDERHPSLGTRIIRRLKKPETVSDLLLAAKAVIAATAAWAISVGVLGSDVAFMAPWTALLTVHATVHRSLSRGAQTTVATAVGMGLAWVIMTFLGVNIWTFALALFVGLMGARLSWIRDEGVAIATTAIFIFTAEDPMFADRFLELFVGVGIGILVNVLVLPPLKDQQAARYVDSLNRRIGAVLVDMADEFSEAWDTEQADEWIAETHSMNNELNSGWQMVRLARESRRENPRRFLRKPRDEDHDIDYEEVLNRIDEAISHLRNMTRTMRVATWAIGEWDERFRKGWVDVARSFGEAIADPDRSITVERERLDDLITEMSSTDNLPKMHWPLYGSMLSTLDHLGRLFDDGTTSRETRETQEDEDG